MKRREFVGLIGATAISFPRLADAQTKTDLPLIGLMLPQPADSPGARDRIAAVRKGLLSEGFIEGVNYSLAIRFAEGDVGRYPQLVKELGARNARVILMGGFIAGVIDFWRSYPEVPVVFAGIAVDLVAMGYLPSYTKPGGMLTGSMMTAVGGVETVAQKRMELFKQLVPNLTRLGLIALGKSILGRQEKDALQNVADRLGFELIHYTLDTIDDLERAVAAAKHDDVSVFYISQETQLVANMPRVVNLVAASERPSVGSHHDWARSGLLMSYGNDPIDGFQTAGTYVAKILRGAKPGDLPIEQATKFKFVINLKTAKTLGIVVSPNLLALADEVIE